MERPDQAKFDRFSNQLDVLNAQLQAFAASNHLEYLRDVKRKPNRELHNPGNPLLMFGIHLEGVWYDMNNQDDQLYTVGASGVLTASDGMKFVRKQVLLQHQPLATVKAEMASLLIEWKNLMSTWAVPDLTEDATAFKDYGWFPVRPRGVRVIRNAPES